MANNNRKAGIGFRGAHWKMSNDPATVHVSTDPDQAYVDVGSGGGYLYFFSRVSDASWLEFQLGAMGEVETHTEYFYGDETDVNAVTPVLLGLRHDLFSYDTESSLIPYISLGVGPYWFNDIYVKTEYFGFENETEIRTKAKMGGYAGGGVNFMMTSWFGINFDARYHFINFDVNHDKSGWEFGLGVMFAWGQYKKPVYRERRYHRGRRGRDDVNIYID
jgi:hypothetical protein